MTLYAETSAVLAWLFGEPAGGIIKRSIDGAARVVSSVLTIVEAERAIARAEGLALITPAAAAQLRGLAARTIAQWSLLEVVPSVHRRAGQVFPRETVRTLDALHLASALELLMLHPDLRVLTLNDRIAANLEPLGLAREG